MWALSMSSQLSSNCVLQGEAVTWQKLSAIQAACDIELTFDRCLAMVKAAEAQVRSRTTRADHRDSITPCNTRQGHGCFELHHRMSRHAVLDEQQ